MEALPRSLAILVVLAALALAAPAAAPAQGAMGQTSGVLVAPEGDVAYAGDYQTLLVLRRDPATGALRFEDGPGRRAQGGRTYELAPDGGAVYTSNGSWAGPSIVTHLRNPDGTLREGPHLNTGRRAHDLAFSRDGRTLFASEDTASGEPPSVHVIARDPATGALSSTGHVQLPREEHTRGAFGLAVAPDDRFLYVGDGDRVHVLALGDGLPQVVQTTDRVMSAQGSAYAESLALSPDGTRLYTGPMNLAAFAVDRDSGLLTALAGADFGVNSGWSDGTHRDVLVAPDGGAIYASERRADAIHQATPTAEGAQHARTYRNYGDAQGLDHPGALTLSPDGLFVYASTGELYANGAAEAIVVFRRDPQTNALSFASVFEGPTLSYQRPGSLGPCTAGCGNGTGVTTVTINDGAAYTNDPNVILTIDPGHDVAGFFADNDGGMRNALHLPASPDERYAWTLQSTGPERLPKTVYVRPNGHGPSMGGMVTDDIVLDETRPAIVALRARSARLHVVARDRTSGVARLQLARAKRKPLPWRQARDRTTVALARGAAWVRVRDAAGNRSAWRRIPRSGR